ncbi:pilus assembly protein CpaE [Paraburkholderia ginsengiterrae]|uniref:Pilus assembly protein CpaE n=1 Tax=Paraburkholderia ginsengiterrae TaxID=1462993 RepID=A0A1A9NGY4_9BURK|nr:AAA family ATPase [Paraburkholderia ginsengiterrae]OAJ62216.1 pilus assembly protein CpaE [Paraburkholderia ginsengiterrae]OAJ65425.1 pilus assembly protein CpaE [Paraburkholderia ginsengiterrae]
MIDIFLISSSSECARQIVARLDASGVAYRLRTATGPARQLRTHDRQIRSADLLIVADADLEPRDLDGVEEVLACTPALHCILVTPEPSTALLGAAMRVGVRHVLSWPLDACEITTVLIRIDARKKDLTGRRTGRIISLASSKGGSGTTLIAVNLAYSLAATGNRHVLLIDLSQQFGDASLLLADKPPPTTLADLCCQTERLDAALLDSCVMHVHSNLDVLAGAGDPLKAAELLPEQLARILALVRERYDAVLIDIGQSLNPLTIHALDRSDAICMVVRQNLLYLHGGRRMLDIFRELGYPASKVRVVVNQYDKDAQINLPKLEQTLGAKVSHQLPRDEKQVNEALSRGLPLVTLARDSALAHGIGLLANMLWPAGPERRKSMIGRLLAARPSGPPQLKPGR